MTQRQNSTKGELYNNTLTLGCYFYHGCKPKVVMPLLAAFKLLGLYSGA